MLDKCMIILKSLKMTICSATANFYGIYFRKDEVSDGLPR